MKLLSALSGLNLFPSTGDNSAVLIWVLIALAVVCAAAAGILIYIKVKQKKR